MAYELQLGPAVTEPTNDAAVHYRHPRRYLGRQARRPRHPSDNDPSGPHLPAPDIGIIAAHRPHAVVELEPGDPAITDVLRNRLSTGSTLIGVTSDDATAGYLRRTRPWLTVLHGDAADLGQLLNTAGVAGAHLVIGALFPALTAEATQRRVIAGVADVLHPDGSFATVVALPAGSPLTVRRLRRRLGEVFAVVTHTALVWHHGAPAYLLVARNPTRPTVDIRRGDHVSATHTDLLAAA